MTLKKHEYGIEDNNVNFTAHHESIVEYLKANGFPFVTYEKMGDDCFEISVLLTLDFDELKKVLSNFDDSLAKSSPIEKIIEVLRTAPDSPQK
jgi:hypothetical protein